MSRKNTVTPEVDIAQDVKASLKLRDSVEADPLSVYADQPQTDSMGSSEGGPKADEAETNLSEPHTPQGDLPDFVTEEEILAREGYKVVENNWVPHPVIANQADNFPSSSRIKETRAEMLNLSDTQDMVKFNQLIKNSHSPRGNIRIISQTAREFDWRVLLILEELEFKNIVPLEKKDIPS
jgi:hypothetical protein